MEPLDLGLGPAPTPPPVPTPTSSAPSTTGKLIQLALLGLAGGLGPGAGTGLAQGLAQGMQRRRDEASRTDAANRYAYEQQQQNYALQTRAYEQQQLLRQKAMADAVESFGKVAATAKNKAEYDQHAQQFAGMLQAMGIRATPTFFLSAVPYVAPTAKDAASKALDAFLKNPLNKSLLDKPDALASAFIQFDRDGDGIPEQVPISQVAQIAQMPLGTDAAGKVLAFPKGTSAEQKANADGVLQTLLDQAKAEGKDITDPKIRLTLQQQAIRMAKEAGDLGPDPTVQAIRDLQLQQQRDKANSPQASMPPQLQRRVDQKTKAFDSLPIVKRVQTMAEAVSFAQGLDSNTKNPADDQALIYAFAKAMDPDSVVREGEYATVQKYAQSWAQSLGFNAARIFSNTAFLTPQARENMKRTIAARYQAGKAQYDNVRQSYVSQINRITGSADGEDYLTDYGAAFPTAGGDAQTVTVGGKTFGVQVVP